MNAITLSAYWLTLKFSHKRHIQYNYEVIMTFCAETNKRGPGKLN